MATLNQSRKTFHFAALSNVLDDEHDPTQPPAYESRPSSLRIEKQAVSKIQNRLGTIRRYFHSVDLQRTANHTSENKSLSKHRKAISVDDRKQPSSLAHNSGNEQAIGLYSLMPKDTILAQTITPTRTVSPEPISDSFNQTQVRVLPPALSPTKSHIPASSTISEGMLHPHHRQESTIRSQEHYRRYSDQLLGPSITSQNRAMASISTGRTKGGSFIRPISLLFNKSADFLTDRLSASAVSTPTASRDSSFYFNACRAGDTTSKPNAWSKFLDGYVSPKTSKFLPRSLRTSKMRDRAEAEDYLVMRSRKRIRLPENGLLLQRESKTGPDGASIAMRTLGVAIEDQKRIGQRSMQIFLSILAVEGLLLWICPPSNAVALGGNGMLVVYAIMMVALAAISQIFADHISALSAGQERGGTFVS